VLGVPGSVYRDIYQGGVPGPIPTRAYIPGGVYPPPTMVLGYGTPTMVLGYGTPTMVPRDTPLTMVPRDTPPTMVHRLVYPPWYTG